MVGNRSRLQGSVIPHIPLIYQVSLLSVSIKRADTVGEFKSVEMGVPYIPAWKAKTLRKLTQTLGVN